MGWDELAFINIENYFGAEFLYIFYRTLKREYLFPQSYEQELEVGCICGSNLDALPYC